jgi:hypothetical protein
LYPGLFYYNYLFKEFSIVYYTLQRNTLLRYKYTFRRMTRTHVEDVWLITPYINQVKENGILLPLSF